MAGRGRGRGRGRGISINLEQIGLTRSDLNQTPKSQQPPALYPPLVVQPLPLDTGENDRYMLNPQREMRETLMNSPFWIKPLALKKDIVRYSDKYQVNGATNESTLKFMDSSRFPRELVVNRKRKQKIGSKTIEIKRKKLNSSFTDVEQTLTALESKEAQDETEDDKEENTKEEEDDEEKEIEDDEYYDEEELEEGTDYNLSYFDNGDGYLDEEEDNLDDDPVY